MATVISSDLQCTNTSNWLVVNRITLCRRQLNSPRILLRHRRSTALLLKLQTFHHWIYRYCCCCTPFVAQHQTLWNRHFGAQSAVPEGWYTADCYCCWHHHQMDSARLPVSGVLIDSIESGTQTRNFCATTTKIWRTLDKSHIKWLSCW